MRTRLGQKSCAIIGKLITALLLLAMGATGAVAEAVRADKYVAFWLWAGVQPQPALNDAEVIYLLAGEVTGRGAPHIISQRSATPRVKGPQIWVVYRAQTLDWNDRIVHNVISHLESWRAAGNSIAGLQIDFDAGTKHLDRYAIFLRSIRARLPAYYKLSVTGLLDWSANGEPSGLNDIAKVVDEVVLQIYQGRHVIPGYGTYLAKLSRLRLPFKIGLLQGGDWQAPEGLAQDPYFKGYVVFLLNQQEQLPLTDRDSDQP